MAPLGNWEIPPLLVAGVVEIARLFSGSGRLVDLLAMPSADIELEWDQDDLLARWHYQLLLHVSSEFEKALPTDVAEWLDLLEARLERPQNISEYPSAFTDWPGTISKFGRFPSPLYVERAPIRSFDTPHTRTLKWLATTLTALNEGVRRRLGQSGLTGPAAELVCTWQGMDEIAAAADTDELDEHDLLIVRASGGVWLVVESLAFGLAAALSGSPERELEGLLPILPFNTERVFELAVLGICVQTLRATWQEVSWRSNNPVGAARRGQPCINATSANENARLYFQTSPAHYRKKGPYTRLATVVSDARNVRGLIPDIWVLGESTSGPFEMLIECKFSSNPPYIRSGIIELLSYNTEFAPDAESDRANLLIIPDDPDVRPSNAAHRSFYAALPLADFAGFVRKIATQPVASILSETSAG